jgi:hypothetical protein
MALLPLSIARLRIDFAPEQASLVRLCWTIMQHRKHSIAPRPARQRRNAIKLIGVQYIFIADQLSMANLLPFLAGQGNRI